MDHLGYDPLIINVALTGMVPTKKMTPHVPISRQEILTDVAACVEAGASIVHVHAREPDGTPTSRAEAFAPIVEGIRQIDPEIVICVTCSGRAARTFEERAEVLDLDGGAKPDMGSLTLGSNNFIDQASVNEPDIIKALAVRMLERGIKPELEAFEPGMVSFGRHLIKKGLVETPCYLNILLGNLGTSPLSPLSLAAFLGEIPQDWVWAVAGIGRFQLRANVMGIVAGGHVRVGIEDNIWWDHERTTPATNAQLVRRIASAAALIERDVATPAETRKLLAL